MDVTPPFPVKARTVSVPYICPVCRGALVQSAATLRCTSCVSVYPVELDIVDFAGGMYYDAYEPGQELSEEHRRGLAAEVFGSRWRIENYYAPKLEKGSRVLDCGCGNGVSVDA